jgi:hypothetical protein
VPGFDFGGDLPEDAFEEPEVVMRHSTPSTGIVVHEESGSVPPGQRSIRAPARPFTVLLT